MNNRLSVPAKLENYEVQISGANHSRRLLSVPGVSPAAHTGGEAADPQGADKRYYCDCGMYGIGIVRLLGDGGNQRSL